VYEERKCPELVTSIDAVDDVPTTRVDVTVSLYAGE
jgi:hypothetical protein